MLRATRSIIEADIIGVTPVRLPNLDFAVIGPAQSGHQGKDVKCYDPKNARHVQKELVKYLMASRRQFQAGLHAAVVFPTACLCDPLVFFQQAPGHRGNLIPAGLQTQVLLCSICAVPEKRIGRWICCGLSH